MRVLLLTKDTRFCEDAAQLAKFVFPELLWLKGRVGDPLPEALKSERFAAVLSFVSPWILPEWLLDAGDVALNFHPGSAEYPGTGCYNFALYEGATTYGAVCHHMKSKVDTGDIVKEVLFRVVPNETVESLKFRTMVAMLEMFHEIAVLVASGEPLPRAARSWTRRPFTRKQLNALATLSPSMDPQEVQRRVRATTYPGYPGPGIEIGGVLFRAEVPNRPPVA
ncbi:MAG TPA: formyltransferase family protein [Labilithrix sp.]|nr:formyltransferase family protein [Labilithrix sp.]